MCEKKELNEMQECSLTEGIFRSNHISMVSLNSEMIVESVTSGFETQLHKSKEELIGYQLSDLIHEANFLAFVKKHIEEKRNLSDQLIPFCQAWNKISWIWVEIITWSMEEKTGYYIIFDDVSEAFQAQMLLESSMELTNDIFLFFDVRDRVLYCSEIAAKIFGFANRKEAIGVHYTTFIYNKLSRQLIDSVFEQLSNSQSFHEIVRMDHHGKEVSYDLCAINIMIKDIKTGCVFIFHPVKPFRVVKSEDNSNSLEEDNEENQETTESLEKLDSKALEEYRLYLKELEDSLLHFEYVRINELLERLVMIAPKRECPILQGIQYEIDEFQYESALNLFREQFNLE